MRLIHRLILGALCAAPLGAFAGSMPAAGTSAMPSAADGLHLNWIDRAASPTQNFFLYANGNWMKDNPVPPAYSSWGQFSAVHQRNLEVLRQILESAANTHAAAGSDTQKIGDFYASGMDEAAVNADGIKPLQPELDRIAAIHNRKELQAEFAHLQTIGVNALFNFGPMQDFKDSSKVIGAARQGGLTLPDREYYLSQNSKFTAIRTEYVQNMSSTFVLMGEPIYDAGHDATAVLDIETALAQASMTREKQRDPKAVYHIMTLKKLAKETPEFSWPSYLAEMGQSKLKSINLSEPLFFKAMNLELIRVPLDNWKAYLRWHLVHTYAPYLSQAYVQQDFQLQSALSGAKELLPRWQRVINSENRALGFAVGEAYVAKAFPPSSKQAAIAILHGVRHALNDDLASLSWMGKKTRLAAIKKLDMMGERIGYPDKWRDYSALTID
ncbi:MAG: M13 family metallopeptidase, partial [Gammaproteobacteria bacterium]